MNERATARVLSPGFLTTVQDLGRPGLARFGVTPGGALDRRALILGNRLLGNEPGYAALEITLTGPTLSFTAPVVIAVTGADLGARLNDRSIPNWSPVRITAGDELSFFPSAGAVGARAYLCIGGGFDVEPVLSGRGTDLLGGFGGWQGRALAAGDELPIGEPSLPIEAILRRQLVNEPPSISSDAIARFVPGPQWDRFTERGVEALRSGEFTVSPRSNRQGIRLSGPPLEHRRGADIVSEGIANGAVQVPGDRQPIVLLAARQTVGGYAKIATVAGADMDSLGQLRPGGRVTFAQITVEEARAAYLEYRAGLGPDAVAESARLFPGATLDSPLEDIERVARSTGAWDPDGVVRVIGALEAAGVTSFSIEDSRTGFKLEIRRSGADSEPTQTHDEATPKQLTESVITAPVLGVFYRRSAPDQPPLVEVGQEIELGQVIGVLEVMKSYHEIAATAAGVLSEFLVDDGQFVEYGQPIARVEPANSLVAAGP